MEAKIFDLITKLRHDLEACRTGDNDTKVMDAVQTVNAIDNKLIKQAIGVSESSPSWQEILKDAETFAKSRNIDKIDAVRCFEQCAKFIASNVSTHRELLITFINFLGTDKKVKFIPTALVDEFLKRESKLLRGNNKYKGIKN